MPSNPTALIKTGRRTPLLYESRRRKYCTAHNETKHSNVLVLSWSCSWAWPWGPRCVPFVPLLSRGGQIIGLMNTTDADQIGGGIAPLSQAAACKKTATNAVKTLREARCRYLLSRVPAYYYACDVPETRPHGRPMIVSHSRLLSSKNCAMAGTDASRVPYGTRGIGRAGASTRRNLWGALNRSQISARGWAAREQEILGR